MDTRTYGAVNSHLSSFLVVQQFNKKNVHMYIPDTYNVSMDIKIYLEALCIFSLKKGRQEQKDLYGNLAPV